MISRAEKWAVAAIGAFLGTCIVSPFVWEGVIKFLLSWAICTIFDRVFVIGMPDKVRRKRNAEGRNLT